MKLEIKIPSPGESISEVELSRWMVKSGDYVDKDQEIGEVESEKATLPLVAPASGTVTILQEQGKASVGGVVAFIETSSAGTTKKETVSIKQSQAESMLSEKQQSSKITEIPVISHAEDSGRKLITPVARKLMAEHGLKDSDIGSEQKRILKQDVERMLSIRNAGTMPVDRNSRPADRKNHDTPAEET